MGSQLPNLYNLKNGAVFNDLFPIDFMDVMWQAFEKDNLESITLQISRPKGRIKMHVTKIVKKKTKAL